MMPTFEHIIYIPAVLLVGFTFGFRFGARAARNEIERRERLRKK